MSDQVLTVVLDDSTRAALDRAAAALERNASEVVADAVHVFLDLFEWQHSHIAAGLAEADAGDFVSEEEWRAAFGRSAE